MKVTASLTEKHEPHNRRLAKKRVQCLNEVLCFVSSSVLADSLVLRNPLLRQAQKRCAIYYTTLQSTNQKLAAKIKQFTEINEFFETTGFEKRTDITDFFIFSFGELPKDGLLKMQPYQKDFFQVSLIKKSDASQLSILTRIV